MRGMTSPNGFSAEIVKPGKGFYEDNGTLSPFLSRTLRLIRWFTVMMDVI